MTKNRPVSDSEKPAAYSISDFVDKKTMGEFREKKLKREKKRKRFDEVDSIVGEIISRFGWEVYQKWNDGEIDNAWMTRILAAERAREAAKMLELEAVVFKSLVGTAMGNKHPRQSLEQVQDILTEEQKIAQGKR